MVDNGGIIRGEPFPNLFIIFPEYQLKWIAGNGQASRLEKYACCACIDDEFPLFLGLRSNGQCFKSRELLHCTLRSARAGLSRYRRQFEPANVRHGNEFKLLNGGQEMRFYGILRAHVG